MAAPPMIPKWMLTIFAFLAMKPMLSNPSLTMLEPPLFVEADPDLYYNTMEYVCNEGYPVQEHKLATEDGYILRMHRIPNGNRKERLSRRGIGYTSHHHHVHPAFNQCVRESLRERGTGPPVILQHGLIGASDWWILQGAGKDLAYLLADAGYDVWLSNSRGNYYSRSHTYLSTESKEFWDFSFQEIGIYDLPAVIDHVLKETGHKQVYYIGYSFGTSEVLILGSTRSEYMQKIRLAILLAPVVNLSDSFVRGREDIAPPIVTSLIDLFDLRGIHEVLERQDVFAGALARICNSLPFLRDLCYDIGILVDEKMRDNLEPKTAGRVLTHYLSGTSLKMFKHIRQLHYAKRFQEYDYGPEENYRVYNHPTSRNYNFRLVTFPAATFYSDSDIFVDNKHVRNLDEQLPNLVFSKAVTNMVHTDFLFARNAKEKIYDDVLKMMAKY